MKRLLREMPEKGVERDVVCFNSAVTACAKSGRWEEAVALLAEMVASPAPPAAASGAPGSAAKRERDRSGAVGTWGPGTSSAARGSSRGGCGDVVRSGAAQPAGRLFCRPNVVTYNAAMQACGSAGQWREALRLLRAMLADNIAPNATSFTSAIAACGSAGEWEQARRLLGAVKGVEGAAPLSVGSYNAAIKACGDAGRIEEAVGILREMEADARGGVAPPPDVTTYTSAIKATGAEYKQAILLLREMPTKDLTPSRISYNAAITACGRGGKWELAESLFRELARAGLSPDVISYNSVISALGGAGQWERAVGYLGEMSAAGGSGDVAPDGVSFAAASLACERAGRFGEAAGLRAEASGLGLGLLKAREAEGAGDERGED